MKLKNKEINKGLLSVIVPAYKQEKTIVRDIRHIERVLNQIRLDYEIICVVDGFVDSTTKNAKGINSPSLKVVGYKDNRGKGHAVRYGMSKAKGDFIAFIDSGMDIDANGISMILEHMEWYNADIIVGSKRHPASKVNYPWQRKVLSLGYQILVLLLFNLKVRDTQVGLKVFRKEVLERVLPRLLVKQFAFDVEMLAVANYLGYKRIYEAPVELNLQFGGTSDVTSRKFIRTVGDMLWNTLAVFYRLRIMGYYDDSNKKSWIRHDRKTETDI